MAIRFRRRVRLFPGVHLNISGSGVGMSVGPRGATVSIGSSGIFSATSLFPEPEEHCGAFESSGSFSGASQDTGPYFP